jgi:hypothetical protein
MTFDQIAKIVGLVGGLAGALTLIWRLVDVFKAYLHIQVTVEKMQGPRVKIRTVVENTNTVARKLDGAFLVIGPESEDPGKTILALLNHNKNHDEFKNLNDVIRFVTHRLKRDVSIATDKAGRMIIPLPYYFKENYAIADETLTYEQTVDCVDLPAGTYAVRFYIEGVPRLYRLVHAAFEVPVSFKSTDSQ